MNITIRLTKDEYEMLQDLQKKDRKYQQGLETKVKSDIMSDYKGSWGKEIAHSYRLFGA